MTEMITLIIATYGPAIVALLGIIGAVIRNTQSTKKIVNPILAKYDELVQKVEDKTDLTEARTEMRMLIQENAELRSINYKVLSELSKVKYDDKKI